MIDTNPSATFTTLCALESANFLIAPITMDAFSMRGIHLLTEVLKGRYEWLGNPRQVRLLPNRIPRTSDAAILERLEREENEIRQQFPSLRDSIMTSRIHESKLLSHKSVDLGFVADRRLWPMHRHWQTRVKEDFEAAAREILLSLKEAFGETGGSSDAGGNEETTLDAMRREYKEERSRSVG